MSANDNTHGDKPPKDSRGQFCRIFNESAKRQGHFTLRDTDITVDAVLAALKETSEDEVLEKFEGLRPRDIEICRAIATHFIENSQEYQDNGTDSSPTLMLDENLPYLIIPRILTSSARITHISFAQLTREKDPTIWDYAKNKNIAAFITRDSDFIRIAESEVLKKLQETTYFEDTNVTKLPLVVHLASEIVPPYLVEQALKEHAVEIARLASTEGREFSYVTIDSNGLTIGPTPKEIYRHYMHDSLSHIEMTRPVFDIAIVKKQDIINSFEASGMEPIPISEDPYFHEFYELAQGMKPATQRSQNDPSSGPF